MARVKRTEIDAYEWEAVHEKGLVYKRIKRRFDPTAFSQPPDPIQHHLDHSVVLSQSQTRKRNILLRLKDKYSNEIRLWEQLSDSLNQLQHRTSLKDTDHNNHNHNRKHNDKYSEGSVVDGRHHSLLSQALLQVEAQEAVIRDFSHLCEVAEALCSAHEDRAKQQFFDLPIWESPRKLVASLCKDQ